MLIPNKSLIDYLLLEEILEPDPSEEDERLGRLLVDGPPRNLATKIMSNGVEVIVKGNQTHVPGIAQLLGTPSQGTVQAAITLPPTMVSNQFHLIENPGRPMVSGQPKI